MVLPFFGKKPVPGTRPAGDAGGSPAPDAAPLPAAELSSPDLTDHAPDALAQYADLVEVREVGAGIGAVYEEAAVLYANGNVPAAEAVLDSPSNHAREGVWMMLLDLYRLTGQRQRFETRVLDYATRFERSPPPWLDLSAVPARERPHPRPLVTLSGSLSGQAAAQFEQIAVIGKKSGTIRIDLGHLRSVDENGCAMFRQLLKELAAERVTVSLLKCARLADMLVGQVHPGCAEGRDGWLLLLEMLQHTGEQDRFEQLAVDYAITFEESPPSWEPKAEQEAQSTAALEAVAAAKEGFSLDGEVTGAAAESMRKLAAYAAERQRVEVDCVGLRRMDFVSAGMLFNTLADMKTQGKQVILKNVNAMVAALLRVMSVDQVAQVTLRA
ncbi:STAS domain-containing protein [Aromatoleum sp.]|uniref:STAS domain-containing protein n=1 Tax=Aromatoleum sp. TaxID=2307007 RepID=UPI002FCBA1A6